MGKTITTPVVKKDHPGVYIPPPMFYVAVFLVGIGLQKSYPVTGTFFEMRVAKMLGVGFIIVTLLFLTSSIRQFIVSKNTLIPIKPATSLQTTGVYAITRNPMYTGLLALYIGVTFIIGNWWNFILLPPLVLIVQMLVIRKEEKYLQRRFGSVYGEYKRRVRRWI